MITNKAENYYKVIKKYLNFQKIEDLKNFLKELSIHQCASVSYVPLAGWIFPLVMNKNNPTCRHHLKQGFVISMLFIFLSVFLNLVNIFTPSEWRYFRLGLVIFIYFVNLLYLIFSIIAVRIVQKGRDFNIKGLNRFEELIRL